MSSKKGKKRKRESKNIDEKYDRSMLKIVRTASKKKKKIEHGRLQEAVQRHYGRQYIQ